MNALHLARPRISGLALFIAAWFFIATTSTIDAYLAVHYAPVLKEENPLGELLIRESVNGAGQDVSLLIGVKMFGTILVLGFLLVLHGRWQSGARAAALGLAACQLLLMLYILL